MKRIPLLFLALLLAACSTSQPATPSPTPLLTLTPAPTDTPTPIPTATPTSGPAYPASLSPEDQQWLAAHQGDPDVSWAYDEATGNTTVTINSDFDITNPALVDQIKARCENGDCSIDFDDKIIFMLTGKFSGDMEIIIAQDGGVELATSMVTVNHSNELVPVKFRLILDKRNKVNDILWEQLSISDDEATIEQLAEIFREGDSLSLSFFSAYLPNNRYVKQYLQDYPREYYEGVRAWFEGGMSPRNVPDELIVSGAR